MPTVEETAAAELLATQLANMTPAASNPSQDPIVVPPTVDATQIGAPHLHAPAPSIAPPPFPAGTHFARSDAEMDRLTGRLPDRPVLVRDFARDSSRFVQLFTPPPTSERTWIDVSKITRLQSIPPVASPVPQPMQIRIYTGDGLYVDVYATRELFEAVGLPSPL